MQRVEMLVGAFEHIARTRMAGVPVLHAGLKTEALGFAPQCCDEGLPGVLGVLVTPWFMNLLWLPPDDAPALALGASRLRRLGGETLSFLGAEEAGCRFEACSLFSPMFEFQDQDAARAVALAALQALRGAPVKADVAPAPVAAATVV
ncbi:[NiFe]-hydrogenase assembly chaperone HybE, partial [Azohydromonas lata]